MAVLTNTMLQGSSADTGVTEGPYQIKNSAIFDKGSSSYLSRDFRQGNQCQWTFAAWVKWHDTDSSDRQIFGSGNNYLRLDASEFYNGNFRVDGSNTDYLVSWRGLKTDHSAWHHLCLAVDQSQKETRNRFRLWINGELIEIDNTDWSPPPQNGKLEINKADQAHDIGKGSSCSYLNASLADVRFLDGLSVGPSMLGEYDSSGAWNPTDLVYPQKNANTTWSDNVTTSDSSWSGNTPPKGFDGQEITDFNPTNANTTITVTFPTPITVRQGVRIQLRSRTRTHSAWSSWITGDGLRPTYIEGDDCYQLTPVQIEYGTKLSNLTITPGSGYWSQLAQIEVDGIILRDGYTDPDAVDNPNSSGKTWSSMLSAGSGLSNASNAFDGTYNDWSTASRATSSSGGIKFTPTGGLAYKHSVEVFIEGGNGIGSNDQRYKFNGGSLTTCSGQEWTQVAAGEGTMTSVEIFNYYNGSAYGTDRLDAIRVDGHVLVDNAHDNSVKLGFEANSHARSFGIHNAGIADKQQGTDADGEDITAPTGGLPILKTKDDWWRDLDDTPNSAINCNADSLASSLKLCLPFHDNAYEDVNPVGRSSSNISKDGDNDVTYAQPVSPFYAVSCKFDGHTNKTAYIGLGTHSSLNFTESSTFCIETWVWLEDIDRYYVFTNYNYENGWTEKGYIFGFDTSGYLYMKNQSNGSTATGNVVVPTKEWVHIACTSDGTSIRLFQNGALVETHTSWGDPGYSSNRACIGGIYYYSGYQQNNNFKGYMSDLRIYSGVSKYTSAFTVPKRPKLNSWKSFNFSGSRNPKYSCQLTSSNGFYSGAAYGATAAFDGNVASSDALAAASGGSFTLKFEPPLTNVTKFEVHLAQANRNKDSRNYTLGGTGITDDQTISGTSDPYTWKELTTTSTTVSELTIQGNSTYAILAGVRVNGTILTDGDAGSTYDGSTDSPTNYLPTGDSEINGAVTRGNYATLHPASVSAGSSGNTNHWTLSEGSLKAVSSGSYGCIKSTIGVTSGKWYAEARANASGSPLAVGIVRYDHGNTWFGGSASDVAYAYLSDGRKATTNDSRSNFANSWTTGDVIGIAFDCDNGTVSFFKNGKTDSPQGQAFTGITPSDGPWFFASGDDSNTGNSDITWNFGQKPFQDTPPDGYKPLCTHNLPNSLNPSKHFDVASYVGNGGTQNVNGFGFGPDLVFIKSRAATYDMAAFDQTRGVNKRLRPTTDAAEGTDTTTLTAFGADGFTSGNDDVTNKVNDLYTAWMWDAGTTGGANTDGSINISSGNQWLNATAGFSITKWTGTNANATIGHGLNAVPEFIILKRLGSTSDWGVYHKNVGNTGRLKLNTDGSTSTHSTFWQDTSPTNSVFSVGTSGDFNGHTEDVVAYCWTPIEGYSKFGTYEGTDENYGPFVYLGFRPALVIIKGIDASANWISYDSRRNPQNRDKGHTSNKLYRYISISQNNVENTTTGKEAIEIYSNGFRPGYSATNTNDQTNNNTLVYAAWAAQPFKTARST